MKTHRIFISYARGDDEPFVRRLHADLTAAGFQVWFDLTTGPFDQRVHELIRNLKTREME